MAIPNVVTPIMQAQITPQILQQMQQRNLAQKIAQQKLAALPAQQQAALARNAALTGLTQAQIGSIPGQEALRAAQVKKYLAQAKSPLSGQSLSGAPAVAASLQVLKNKFGVDSEVYKNALAGYQADLSLKHNRSAYFGSNVEDKYLTPTQKLLKAQHENATIEKGGIGSLPLVPANRQSFSPVENKIMSSLTIPTKINNPQVMPQDINDANNQVNTNNTPNNNHDRQVLQAALQKRVSDAPTRERALASGELLDTMNHINFAPAAYYAGPGGYARLQADAAIVSAGGKPPPNYAAYQVFKNGQAKIIGDSVRQALKTSVRSEYVRNMLMPLADPTMKIWGNDPQLAMQRYQFFRNWVQHYHSVYQHASNYGVTSFDVQQKQTPQTLNIDTNKENTVLDLIKKVNNKELLFNKLNLKQKELIKNHFHSRGYQ